MIMNSPPHHRHLLAPACPAAQTAAPQALPPPSATTAAPPSHAHVSDMASPARATELSSTAADPAVVIVTTTHAAHPAKTSLSLPTPAATAWSSDNERSIIIKRGRGECERRRRRQRPFIHFGCLYVSFIHIAMSGWFPGTLYEPESAAPRSWSNLTSRCCYSRQFYARLLYY